MARQYITCYDLQYVKSLTDTLSGYCLPSSLNSYPLYEQNNITLRLSPNEITQLFSALMTGADLIYPEQNQQVLWLFWRALVCPFERVLFADDYLIDEVSPIASPRTDVPVASSVVTQLNSGAFKILSGEIVVDAVTTTNAAGDLEQETSDRYNRSNGLAMLLTFRRPTALSGDVRIGFADAGDTLRRGASFRFNGSQVRAYANLAQVNQVATLQLGVVYQFGIVFNDARVFYCVRGGIYTDWTLLWVSRRWTATSNILATHMHLVPHIGDAVSRFRVVNVGARFVADNAIADYDRITVTASDALTMRPDFLVEFDVGTISATDKVFTIRTQDGNNNWRIVLNTTSTNLYEVVANNPVLRGSGVAVASNDNVLLIVFGTTIELHAGIVRFFNYNSAANFANETDLVLVSGDDLLTFSSYARTLDLIDSQELSLA